MTLDFATLDTLRTHHPAWRLLRSDHAPLVASFLHRVFVAPNVRMMAAPDLAEALEDELYFRLRGVQRATLLRAGQLPEPEAGQLLALCDSLAMGA